MEYKEWLLNLKKDADVFATQRNSVARPYKVSRSTKSSIFVVMGKYLSGKIIESRFNAQTGRKVGQDSYKTEHLLQPTELFRDDYKKLYLKAKARQILQAVAIPNTTEELNVFIDLLQKYVKPSVQE